LLEPNFGDRLLNLEILAFENKGIMTEARFDTFRCPKICFFLKLFFLLDLYEILARWNFEVVAPATEIE